VARDRDKAERATIRIGHGWCRPAGTNSTHGTLISPGLRQLAESGVLGPLPPRCPIEWRCELGPGSASLGSAFVEQASRSRTRTVAMPSPTSAARRLGCRCLHRIHTSHSPEFYGAGHPTAHIRALGNPRQGAPGGLDRLLRRHLRPWARATRPGRALQRCRQLIPTRERADSCLVAVEGTPWSNRTARSAGAGGAWWHRSDADVLSPGCAFRAPAANDSA